MNKSAKLILFLSIAANVVLFAGFAAGYVSIKKSSTEAARTEDRSELSPEAAKKAKDLLTTDDMAALRDSLRALGLPDSMAREIVGARIASRYTARLREIGNAALEDARQRPYWRGKPAFNSGMMMIYTPEQQKELNQIRHDITNETSQVLGKSADEASGYYQARYAFLSPDKAAQLEDLNRDYHDLRDATIREMSGFRMPGDDEKLKVIDAEKQRDMQALLTPEERAEDALRSSHTAWTLQRVFIGFNGTEEEYKAIFALQNQLEEKYPYDAIYTASKFGGADTSDISRARDEEQKNIDAQIKEMLGEERYADYLIGQRQDYQTLQSAAQRFNFSEETVAQTYQVRDNTANEAKRISEDASLSAAQKTEAFAALAEQATAQIKASLGDDVGDAYINNALGWLKNLPKGKRVTIGAKGNVTVWKK